MLIVKRIHKAVRGSQLNIDGVPENRQCDVTTVVSGFTEVGTVSVQGTTIIAQLNLEGAAITAKQFCSGVTRLLQEKLDLSNLDISVQAFWEIRVQFMRAGGVAEQRLLQANLLSISVAAQPYWVGDSLYVLTTKKPDQRLLERLDRLVRS